MPDYFTIGAPLLRAEDAYASREKWTRWILASRGHGREWARVLHAQRHDAPAIWLGIAQGVRAAPIYAIRHRGTHGVVCGVMVRLALNDRTALVTTSWHYSTATSAPRLVTAYPAP